MQIVNKITMKVVMGGDVKDFVIENEQIDLVQVMGIAKKKEVFNSTFGGKVDQSWCIHGEVKAINLQTKEQFYSPNRCFLPPLASELLATQLDDTDHNCVKWAFVLGVKWSKAQVGYEYTVKPLLKPAEHNDLDNIEKEINALPSPKQEEQSISGGPALSKSTDEVSDPSEIKFNQ